MPVALDVDVKNLRRVQGEVVGTVAVIKNKGFDLVGDGIEEQLKKPYPMSLVPVLHGHLKAGLSIERRGDVLDVASDQDYGRYVERAPSTYRQSQDRSAPVKGSIQKTILDNISSIVREAELKTQAIISARR